MKKFFLLIGLVVFLTPFLVNADDLNDSYCIYNPSSFNSTGYNKLEIACFCQRAYDNSVYTTNLSPNIRTDDPCGYERFLNNQITYGTYLNLGGEKIK